MQRKSQKDQSADRGQWFVGLRLRGHAAAERLAAGKERNRGCQRRRFGYGRPNGRMTGVRGVRALGAPFHVRELVAQCRNTVVCQLRGYRREKGMTHPCPGSVRQHEASASLLGHLQQA